MCSYRHLLLLVALICLLFYVRTGAAIKCYVCTSMDSNEGCMEPPLNESFLIDCNDPSMYKKKNDVKGWSDETGYTMCRKIDLDTKQGIRLWRDCAFIPHTDNETDFWYVQLGDGFHQFVYQCDKDGCNSADRITPVLVVFTSAVLAATARLLL